MHPCNGAGHKLRDCTSTCIYITLALSVCATLCNSAVVAGMRIVNVSMVRYMYYRYDQTYINACACHNIIVIVMCVNDSIA